MRLSRRMTYGGIGEVFPPVFTYTGTYEFIDDGDKNWRLKLKSSGTLTFTKIGSDVDIFLVGGGAGGSGTYNNQYTHYGGVGGNGGKTNLVTDAKLSKGIEYSVTIGSGGNGGGSSGAGKVGGTSTITGNGFTWSATGGEAPTNWYNNSKNGGSGGGGQGSGDSFGGKNGGTDGGNGSGTNPGKGMGTYSATGVYYVREFRESGGARYSGGGGSGAFYNAGIGKGGNGGGGNGGYNSSGHRNGHAGTVNTGGGGGGAYGQMNSSYAASSGAGGSGIIVIRNKRS